MKVRKPKWLAKRRLALKTLKDPFGSKHARHIPSSTLEKHKARIEAYSKRAKRKKKRKVAEASRRVNRGKR